MAHLGTCATKTTPAAIAKPSVAQPTMATVQKCMAVDRITALAWWTSNKVGSAIGMAKAASERVVVWVITRTRSSEIFSRSWKLLSEKSAMSLWTVLSPSERQGVCSCDNTASGQRKIEYSGPTDHAPPPSRRPSWWR